MADKLSITIRTSPLCKTCNCGFVEDVHQLRLQEKTYDEIIKFLKEKGVSGESLPTPPNLTNHFKYHFVISDVKRQEILERVRNRTVPTMAIVSTKDVENLLTKEVDYLASLKILIKKKIETITTLEERLEAEKSLEVEDQLSILRLIQTTEKNLSDLLDKIDLKQEAYRDVSLLREFIISLTGAINELENASSEKELIKNFRIKISNLVRSYEN